MRYDDWDVLLFPSNREERIPLKEFKVQCHVVPDADFLHNRGTFGVPVMTCFVPGLQAGAPFHISIHCWGRPKASQYTQSYSKHPDLVIFEARVFIDGCMVASTILQPFGAWPHLVASTCLMTKQGELEQLRFPSFRRELLFQEHWSPNDDIGRIKILISEGYPRDSPSNPIERVKNVVTYAFQHAPLEILETNGIAWPNPQLWRRPRNNPALPVPTYHPDDGADSHLHSPHRRSVVGQDIPTISTALTAPFGSTPSLDAFHKSLPTPQNGSTSSGSSFLEPFNHAAYLDWIDSFGPEHTQLPLDVKTFWPSAITRNYNKSDIDISMATVPGFSPSAMRSGLTSDPMTLHGPNLDEDTHMEVLKVPTKTPTAFIGAGHTVSGQFSYNIPNSAVPSELAHSLTQSLLNQPSTLLSLPQSIQPHQIQLPASEIKSRKETRHLNNTSLTDNPSAHQSPLIEAQIWKCSTSNAAFGIIGNDRADSSGSGSGVTLRRHAPAVDFGRDITNTEMHNHGCAGSVAIGSALGSGSEGIRRRSHNFTLASDKAIDEEDESRRSSPLLWAKTTLPLDLKSHGNAEK